MVCCGPGFLGAEHRDPSFAQPVECLGTGYFVYKVRVDIQGIRKTGLADDHVLIPYLVN
jgi:hypothetical protein